PVPTCENGLRCGNPPPPAPPLITGKTWTSGLGYRFEYDPHYWSVVSSDANDVSLKLQSSKIDAVLSFRGAPETDSSPQTPFDEVQATLTKSISGLSPDTDQREVVLRPAVGS